ncbi:hypothetical protein [Thermocrinis minervae]|uniref:Uncharacterized protein n=1 Tax=Thermocrinis minervae TaxID=381751 RepID=A0A1M6T3F6_9AQUI|nr:hypothetical protein [Thermocrinis minervae]SHK51515.1 hypothetical protein SAMN05444391_1286 [Thermocrinis minervae]
MLELKVESGLLKTIKGSLRASDKDFMGEEESKELRLSQIPPAGVGRV